MAAVMGHGGGGGDEPPHPFGGGFGDHQNDAVPPKRRGMADVDVNAFLQNPTFVTAIGDIIRSFKTQVYEENNDGEDGGEDEDN
ncbi:unnamed protein product [Lactuca saligna]|uniref:Uncharacterized protein n=1 Tax=Lactuca saligna TaxID=75948 RepID=A0AA35YLW0_LACSI|nr:unnamed protein product [Lactuca saligna]